MKAYLGLGSNLGERYHNLSKAVENLSDVAGLNIESFSPIYETEPVGNTDQPFFLNAVVGILTSLSAADLLDTCLNIENTFGRLRNEKWGPRPIDIDILFYADEVIDQNNLIVPHPRLHERAFVLTPLADIAPDMMHPLLDKTVKELLKEVDVTGITLTKYQLRA